MRLSFSGTARALIFFKAGFWKTGARRRQGFAEGGFRQEGPICHPGRSGGSLRKGKFLAVIPNDGNPLSRVHGNNGRFFGASF